MKKILLIATLIAALTSCSRYPSVNEIPNELKAEAISILETSAFGRLSPQNVPSSIEKLNPQSVESKEEGLYIKLWSSFIEEGGLFIPRDNTQKYDRSTDPSYWKAKDDMYYYIVKG